MIAQFPAPQAESPIPLTPRFSILILVWGTHQYLQKCLDSLAHQTCQDFELLVLDNGSEIPVDPKEVLAAPNISLRFFRSEQNLGFAGGNNLLAREAKGKYLVALNADAFPEPDWLEQVRLATEAHPKHFLASQLLLASNPNLLDGEWNVYHASGLAWRRNHFKPVNSAELQEREVLSACAAAGIYPKPAFDAVGGFDESFFAYMEDIDLDFRMQLAGYSCIYLPQAKVHHIGSGATSSRSEFVIRHGHRNLIWTFVKNMPGWLFWLLLPAHVFWNLAYILASLGMRHGKVLRQAKFEALKQLPRVWKQRQQVQATRKVSVWSIAKKLDWSPLSPLTKLTYK